MRFIIKSVRTKPAASGNYDEFDEFCESVRSAFDGSGFFADACAPEPAREKRESIILQLISTLCIT